MSDDRTPPPDAVAPRSRFRPVRFLVRLVLLVGVPVVVVLASIHIYAKGGRYVETENAYVKANVVAITPEVSGSVYWVGAEDNTRVKAGQPLLRIDPRPFEIAVDQAEARIKIVRDQIETLRASYREAQVSEATALERVRFAETQLERQQKLLNRKLGAREKFDQAKYDLDIARKEVDAARAQARRILVGLGGSPDSPLEEQPRYRQAVAERDQAFLNLSRAEISAPSDGVVSNMKLQVGEYVEEAEPIFSLVQTDQIWIEANLKETQLTHVREKQRATVEIDAYPGWQWEAEVGTIAPATGAEFALLPPQNATGNWVKVVQRIPVQLDIVGSDEHPPLRAGMTATISIDTGHKRQLPALVRNLLGEDGLPEPVSMLVRRAMAWGERQVSTVQ
jgi:membrane fusion protein (multidrug efflux system)